jgi:hypothetical protein
VSPAVFDLERRYITAQPNAFVKCSQKNTIVQSLPQALARIWQFYFKL